MTQVEWEREISEQEYIQRELTSYNVTRGVEVTNPESMASYLLALGLPTCNCLSTSEGKTRPGQSHNRMEHVRKIVWKCFVWPGVREVLTT